MKELKSHRGCCYTRLDRLRHEYDRAMKKKERLQLIERDAALSNRKLDKDEAKAVKVGVEEADHHIERFKPQLEEAERLALEAMVAGKALSEAITTNEPVAVAKSADEVPF